MSPGAKVELLDFAVFRAERVAGRGKRTDGIRHFDRQNRPAIRYPTVFGQSQKRTEPDGRHQGPFAVQTVQTGVTERARPGSGLRNTSTGYR